MVDDDKICDVGNDEEDENALCFAGLVHHKEITKCWIQCISDDRYNSWSIVDNMSVRAHTRVGWGGGRNWERTDDKCPAKSSTTEFKMLIEKAGVALHRV